MQTNRSLSINYRKSLAEAKDMRSAAMHLALRVSQWLAQSAFGFVNEGKCRENFLLREPEVYQRHPSGSGDRRCR